MTQIVRSQSNIVEKILRDKNGRFVRARFCVYENAGRIKARLLEVTYINEITGSILSLSVFKKNPETISFSKFFSSPYFANDILSFSGNKPRAPTH